MLVYGIGMDRLRAASKKSRKDGRRIRRVRRWPRQVLVDHLSPRGAAKQMVTQPDVDSGVWVHVAVGPRSLSATACLAIVRYYIVAKMDGETMQLHINGELEGITRVYGGMRVPPRSVDGDVTVGCGMYAGKVSDVCSCLITEARVSEGVRRVKDWLWRPAWLNGSSTGAA